MMIFQIRLEKMSLVQTARLLAFLNTNDLVAGSNTYGSSQKSVKHVNFAERRYFSIVIFDVLHTGLTSANFSFWFEFQTSNQL